MLKMHSYSFPGSIFHRFCYKPGTNVLTILVNNEKLTAKFGHQYIINAVFSLRQYLLSIGYEPLDKNFPIHTDEVHCENNRELIHMHLVFNYPVNATSLAKLFTDIINFQEKYNFCQKNVLTRFFCQFRQPPIARFIEPLDFTNSNVPFCVELQKQPTWFSSIILGCWSLAPRLAVDLFEHGLSQFQTSPQVKSALLNLTYFGVMSILAGGTTALVATSAKLMLNKLNLDDSVLDIMNTMIFALDEGGGLTETAVAVIPTLLYRKLKS